MADDDKKKGINEDENPDDMNDDTGSSEEDETKPDDDSGNNGSSSSKEKTFTQEEVTKMMAKEKRQGKRSALKELGIDPKDKETLSKIKELISSKSNNESSSSDEKNNSEIKEYEKRVKVAETKSAAMIQGAKSNFVEDIVVLALAKIDDYEDEDELKDAISEIKSKNPTWFSDGSNDENNETDNGTGSSVHTGNKSSKKSDSLGSRLAATRVKSNKSKSSFWN